MSTSEIGAHIQRQREAMRLDKSVVADLARISAARLSELESGGIPTVWEMSALAAALATDPRALQSGTIDSDWRRSSARFRAPVGIDDLTPHDMRTLARAAEAARTHKFLLGLVGMAPRGRVEAVRSIKSVSSEPAPWKQGYLLGKLAREQLAPKHTPIVSLQGLLEERGVLVLMVEMDSKVIDGASLYEDGASPAILLNRTSQRVKSRLSRRAVLAHELCHLLHDSSKDRDLLTVVSRSNDHSPTEQRANGFAPSFLAPKNWVERREGSDREKVERIAREWGLTFSGAAWHAKNLRIISANAAEGLAQENVEIDPGRFEVDIPRVDPTEIGLHLETSRFGDSALGDLAVRAAQSHLISAGRAAEVLQLR